MIAIKRAKFTKMQLNLNVFQNNLFDLFEPCLERLEKKKKKKIKCTATQLFLCRFCRWEIDNQSIRLWNLDQFISGLTNVSHILELRQFRHTKQFTPNQSNKQFVYY